MTSPMPSVPSSLSLFRRRAATAVVALLTLAATLVPVIASATPAAAAIGDGTADFAGHGWGHGRGMSQYGAYGYAKNSGWTVDQILDHYYGGTQSRKIADTTGITINPSSLRIRLMAMNDTTVQMFGTSAGSTLEITEGGSFAIPPTAKAVRTVLKDDHTGWTIDTAPDCGGPWTPLGASTGATVTVGRQGSDDLFICRPEGKFFYPGSLRSKIVGSGTRTINITTLAEYLRGVVPHEMPASWSSAALQAQAIAARSYVMAGDNRWTDPAGGFYADTCDSTLCQVYKGSAEQLGTGSKVAMTDSRSDAAITATVDVVRAYIAGNPKGFTTGTIARTEFSSTSGGWTAGGNFPAVEDLGDVISPLHNWAATGVSLAPLNSATHGTLTKLFVTKRNGLGEDGGRVVEVKLTFADGTSQLVSGEFVRSKLGLKSDWFTVSTSDCTGTATGDYVDAVHQLFLQRPATSAELITWCDTVVSDGRKSLTSALSVSDEWAGVQIDDLYRKILDRGPDPQGRAYWLDQVRSGVRIEDIATGFYGSEEYFAAAGSTNAGYVDHLYLDLLGRPADAGGQATWTRELDSRRMSRRQVAAQFYASVESRRDRVTALYQTILGRNPDPGGLETWKQQLLTIGDIVLASELAASQEYYNRVTA